MKAAVVHPGGKIKFETVADPIIKKNTDAHIFRHKEEECVKVVLKP